MRIDDYNVELSSENLAINYSKFSSKIRKYHVPEKVVIEISEKKPQIDDKHLQKIKLLKIMLEKLTGKKLKIYIPDDKQYEISIRKEGGQDIVEYENEEEYLNVQYSNFSAKGQVKTKDGRLIDFSIQTKLFQLSYSYTKTSGRVVDPLAIDLKDKTGSQKIVELDLNFDGTREKFFLGRGVGLLVYDKNGNGVVDNAAELFGPVTNEGFSELSQLDTDKDNWIDEDDLEFLKIKIWTIDENGREQVVGLLDLNVGAIFLGSVSTPFDYADSVQKSTGIYLSEDGNVGTVRQIDFKV
ncbi:MAG: hypothetical protein WHS64_07855 [Fervidobacterium sp.]|uniref:VCBS repeat-containing protein n=1 Tax=Fervidobacterium gondwanense DSM 13020 TaxID=1121883 RepID=A0A1M7SDS4_FERGO|nr:hypothetical protein [Fervidobacterium gondwanense]UXF01199.1 hypothetical protein IB67_06505 [Fervidobacterium riparium]SHN56594.1 hypothetical protein SAMN02745226_00792 [Fervidobacterium gondwanense DSM 13020]